MILIIQRSQIDVYFMETTTENKILGAKHWILSKIAQPLAKLADFAEKSKILNL